MQFPLPMKVMFVNSQIVPHFQSHGFEHLVTFLNLKKLGLLMEQDSSHGVSVKPGTGFNALPRPTSGKKSNYKALNKRLGLVPKQGEEPDLKSPTDMSYVFSGSYTPLSCKMVEQVIPLSIKQTTILL